VRKALALAGLAGLLALTACNKKDDPHPAASSQTTRPAPVSQAPPADPATLGPDGFGAIKLGATAAQVKAAGFDVQANGATDPACPSFFEFAKSGDSNSAPGVDSFGYVSPKDGLVAIKASNAMHTPEGINKKSTLAQVKKAYPQLANVDGSSGENKVPVPGNPKAVYSIYLFEDKIVDLQLMLAGTACAAG